MIYGFQFFLGGPVFNTDKVFIILIFFNLILKENKNKKRL